MYFSFTAIVVDVFVQSIPLIKLCDAVVMRTNNCENEKLKQFRAAETGTATGVKCSHKSHIVGG